MTYHKRIETISNVAIIVVAVLLCLVLVKTYFWPSSHEHGARPQSNVVGKKLDVPGVDWAANKRTLLLALQPKCRFCTESAPFYKELAKRLAARPDLKLIAVFPTPIDESKAYLDSLGVPVSEVRQARLSTAGVSGTPAILMVDGDGVVTEVWTGLLDSARENEVLAKL